MPSFKPKTAKKINVSQKDIVTLDVKHKEFLDKFNNNDTVKIPDLLNKKKEIKQILKTQHMTIDKRNEMLSQYNDIKKEIQKLNDEKKNYLLNNSNLIFNYFENKKNISTGNSKKKILDSFFNVKVLISSLTNRILKIPN